MEKEYYKEIRSELEKLTQKQLQTEKMDIVCAGNGKINNVTKNAILKNIKKYDVYYSKSYVQKMFVPPPSEEQKKMISDKLKGRKLSEETKIKISNYAKDNNVSRYLEGKRYYELGKQNPRKNIETSIEIKEKIRIANTGKIRTEEMKKRYSESRKKLMKEQGGLKPETREKISQIISNKIQNGEFNPFGHTRIIKHASPKCENESNSVTLKSSFEKEACIILDNDPNCISYVYEPIQIGYINENGTNSIYIPDFIAKYSNNEIKLLEIKPSKIMDCIPDNLLKQESAKQFCKIIGYKYEFWNEKTMNLDEKVYMKYNEIYYKTYEEFVKAVRDLNINSSTEYRKRYREDFKLPADPKKIYEEFNSWYDVLDKDKKEVYETYKEASEAAQELGIKNKREYYKRYKEDPKLHCAPDEKYKDNGWIDFYDFLGTRKEYYSYEKAREIIHHMKISKVDEYKKQYRLDNMLPSKPERIYKEQWTGWKNFLK